MFVCLLFVYCTGIYSAKWTEAQTNKDTKHRYEEAPS